MRLGQELGVESSSISSLAHVLSLVLEPASKAIVWSGVGGLELVGAGAGHVVLQTWCGGSSESSISLSWFFKLYRREYRVSLEFQIESGREYLRLIWPHRYQHLGIVGLSSLCEYQFRI